MTRQHGTFLSTDNIKVLNAIRNEASLDYQRRIAPTTKANISETLKNLSQYRPLWNEFAEALINRIGSVIAREISWTNPLSEFKLGNLTYGNTIEEYQVGLIESHEYSAKRDYLEKEIFGKHDADVQSSFHTVNRAEYYPITVNENILRRAFTEDGGLSKFVSQVLQAPTTSDQWDEFLLTCSLFAEFEKTNGFHHVQIPDLSTLNATESDARQALKRMRALATNMQYLSTEYNSAGMPTFAKPDEMVLFATPEFVANMDVEALAGAFNIERANVPNRIVQIPKEQFGIDGCQGVLTTKDFFIIADTLLENTSQYNPVSLGTNYFLHHQQIISASKFVPAVMLHSSKNDERIEIPKVSSLALGEGTLTDLQGGTIESVKPGNSAIVNFAVNGENTEGIAVDYEITSKHAQRTAIDNEGVLTVDAKEKAKTLEISGSAVYVDPESPENEVKSTPKTVTINVE